MSDTLFGTDGSRGVANLSTETGINPHTFEQLAFHYTRLLAEKAGPRPKVLVSSDTRKTSPVLREAVAKGAAAGGAEVCEMGEAPTPVTAWAAQKYGAGAIVITASHNPAADNGFKPFDIGGTKPSRDTLDELERRYFGSLGQSLPVSSGRRIIRPDLQNEYLEHLVSTLGGDGALEGKTVIVDGANGAAYELAPRLYRALGAQVFEFACKDDGEHINDNNGAAHLGGVKAFIDRNPQIARSEGFLGAFASDGDGDRVMGVDSQGRTVDGNYWLSRLATGQRGIVGTIYTNSGLREVVKAAGVEFHECANGDSHVTARLQELSKEYGPGFTRGGEFTGHLIDLDHLSSGDGLYMGAWLATEMAKEGADLKSIRDSFDLWPEKMIGVRTTGPNAKAIVESGRVQEAILAGQHVLGKAGRLIVRASGTEPLIRIWAEAQDGSLLNDITTHLSEAVQVSS